MVVAVFAAAIFGCGGSDGRRAVSGHITLDGQPLQSGHITFQPTGGGPTAGAAITNGNYRVSAEQGLTPGEYRVSIKAMRPTGKTYTDSESGQVEQELEQYVPARYNMQSELLIKLTPEGSGEFPFTLTKD